ncbi:hypothetical protein AB0C76_21780 [Kitasatospora sp. NPDC048722]|uniref:hypothetical protein n=1 Tax=Kitasatospora sp. NPDC048722 TaxID=3155639 RepID=UPI0034046B21
MPGCRHARYDRYADGPARCDGRHPGPAAGRAASAAVHPVTLILIPAAAVAAPLLADRLLRWIAVPTVVFEVVLGVLIGPDVLGWAHVDDLVTALSQVVVSANPAKAPSKGSRLTSAPTPRALLLVPAFLVLLLAMRGAPAALLAPAGLGRRDRGALGLYGATAPPLVVVITTIEVGAGHMPSSTAAALVGAGMLPVLLLPLAAQRLRGDIRPPAPEAGRPRVRAESW